MVSVDDIEDLGSTTTVVDNGRPIRHAGVRTRKKIGRSKENGDVDTSDIHGIVSDSTHAHGWTDGLRNNESYTATATHRNPASEGDSAPDSVVPGTQSVWVKTFGCSHNTSDAEFMAGQLHEYGYRLVDDREADEADVWLINSCTVKGPSQSAVGNLVKKAREERIPVVVSGCVPQGQKNAKELEGVSTLGVTQIDRVVEAVEETLKGNVVHMMAKKELPALDLPKVGVLIVD